MTAALPPSLLRRSPLLAALPLALLPLHSHAGEVTVEELARRLQALEQRLGGNTATTDATTDSANLADLDQRLRVIERKLELQAEEAAAKALSTPILTLDAKGLAVKSPGNSSFELKLRGLVQGDGRFYLGDEQKPQNDGFLLRYAEPTIEGSFGPLLGFKLQAQLAGDSATVNDAYLDLRFDPRATVRVGKFKRPFGLEQLPSAAATDSCRATARRDRCSSSATAPKPSPMACHNDPFGTQAEYLTSEQEVRMTSGANAGCVKHLENNASQLLASWVLTGEDASYKSVARPNHPFTVGAAGWGAFELVARRGELGIDDAFPLFVNPEASASLNGYPTQNLKLAAT